MSPLQLPSALYGQWIWKASLAGVEDAFVLMRHKFEIDQPGLENQLWISANCAYQLFINERFVGFGPRAHHGEAAYADCHDVSCYLQSGMNAIAVIVYHSCPPGGCRHQTGGFWCQMEIDGTMVVCSDRSWHLTEGRGMEYPRPRAAADQLMTEYIDNREIAANWMAPTFRPPAPLWSAPDLLVPVTQPGAGLEIYPLEPANADMLIEFQPEEQGSWRESCAWTQVAFGDRHRNHRATSAAVTYLHCDAAEELKVQLFSDDPYRLFCNKHPVSASSYSDGSEMLVLPLRKGWNRVMLLQNPGRNSMGVFFLFPDRKPGSVRISQMPRENAPEAWQIAGPLKLPLNDATASLRFERLNTGTYEPASDTPHDVAAILSRAKFSPSSDAEFPLSLRTGGYLRARLDVLRYGVPVIELEASEGDLVDLSLGYRSGSGGVPSRGRGCRATHTLCCRAGLNRFTLFNPREGLYLMLTVRKAAGEVRIVNCGFEELVRETRNETQFRSSDPELNLLWKIGLHTLRRSAAFVPQIEPRAKYDTYLLDSYIDAVNMVVAFGDHEYAAARLRQFIDAQFENGDIPALTFSNRHRSQVHQLFFTPVWALYNYRTSGDLGELKSLLQPLELLWEFYQSLQDDKTGLLEEIDSRFHAESRLSQCSFGHGSVPTYANALYCRFLLSLAEVYRITGHGNTGAKALQQAQEIAEELRTYNYDPEKHLFAHRSLPGKGLSESNVEYNLFANFTTLLGGIMAMDDFDYFFRAFFQMTTPYDRSEESRSPYFHFLFLETIFALGQAEWGNAYFREYWKSRECKESGSWLGWLDSDDPVPVRFSDGNVVSPNVFLVREVAGVRSADAGHSAIYFNPALDQAEWVDLVLPTASGKLRIRWERLSDGTLKVLIDANYPVKILPELSSSLLKNTIFELSETVTLLQQPK